GFRRLLHLLQHEGADLGGRVFLAAALNPGVAIVAPDDLEGDEIHLLLHHRVAHAAADQPLDAVERVLGIGHALALGGLADQALARFRERDDRWRGAHALAALDHLGALAFHHGDAGIRRPEVDTDYLGHSHLLVQQGFAAPAGTASNPLADWSVTRNCRSGQGLYMVGR